MLSVSEIQRPTYRKNRDTYPSGNVYPCIVCGKPVAKPLYYVHLHDGGDAIVTEAEAEHMDPAADLGSYPVGKDCYSKEPAIRPYAVRVKR